MMMISYILKKIITPMIIIQTIKKIIMKILKAYLGEIQNIIMKIQKMKTKKVKIKMMKMMMMMIVARQIKIMMKIQEEK